MIPSGGAKETVYYTTCSNVFFMKKDFWGTKIENPIITLPYTIRAKYLASIPRLYYRYRQNYGNDTLLGKNSPNDLKIGENEAVLD